MTSKYFTQEVLKAPKVSQYKKKKNYIADTSCEDYFSLQVRCKERNQNQGEMKSYSKYNSDLDS